MKIKRKDYYGVEEHNRKIFLLRKLNNRFGLIMMILGFGLFFKYTYTDWEYYFGAFLWIVFLNKHWDWG